MSDTEPLRLFYVNYESSDDDDLSMIVAATTHQEAFELWRIDMLIDPAEDHDLSAIVYPITSMPDGPGVLKWNHAESESYPVNFINLTSIAIRSEHGCATLETQQLSA